MSAPLVIQGFWMFPAFLENDFPSHKYSGDEKCLYALNYFVSGIVGIVITSIGINKCGRIKYWSIGIASLSSLSTLLLHIIATKMKPKG